MGLPWEVDELQRLRVEGYVELAGYVHLEGETATDRDQVALDPEACVEVDEGDERGFGLAPDGKGGRAGLVGPNHELVG